MGLLRLLIAGIIGCAIALALPRAGVLAATQEVIGFLALLMAGLLPAMTLTATILRGDGFSARRIEDYGRALTAQLRFWATLFFFAGCATAAIVGAKIFSTHEVQFTRYIWNWAFDESIVTASLVGLSGFALGVVMQRLYPAYEGLKSLLDLNVTLARAQALSHDRSLADALEADARAARSPDAYARTKGEPRPLP